jgi:hypothetical protein
MVWEEKKGRNRVQVTQTKLWSLGIPPTPLTMRLDSEHRAKQSRVC